MEYLKTRYKQRPVRGYAYALGTKTISESLTGCKYYSELKVGFDKEHNKRLGLFVPGWSARKLKGNSTELISFRCIISIRYSEALNDWNISNYPIGVEKSETAKHFLIEAGLPIIKKWLNSERAETWFSGQRYLQIGLNESLSEYCVFETHNDRVVEKRIISGFEYIS